VALGKYLESWRFFVLLMTLLAALVFEPVVFGRRQDAFLFDGLYSLVLIASVLALTRKRRNRFVVIAFGIITVLGTWCYHVVPGSWTFRAQIGYHVIGIVFLAYATGATVQFILSGRRVSLDSIFGSIAGYLLLGTAWGLVYSLLHLTSPDAFVIGEGLPLFLEDQEERLPIFIYYSFVTLTTLGYGDMSPVTPAARALSWLEAVSGQLYVATLVAGIVGVVAMNALRPGSQLTPSTDDDDK
jgi:hypothetical protein